MSIKSKGYVLTPKNLKRTIGHRVLQIASCKVELRTLDDLPPDVLITKIDVFQNRWVGVSVRLYFDDGSAMFL